MTRTYRIIDKSDTHITVSDTKHFYKIHSKKVLIEDVDYLHIVRQIRAKKGELLSYNGKSRNYKLHVKGSDFYVNVSEPYDKIKCELVDETPDMYQEFAKKVRPAAPKWVLKIFDGTATGETIFLRGNNYFLMPDFKWNREIDSLYLLALFKDDNLKSVRDLGAEHVDMLKQARDESLSYIVDNYGLDRDKLKVYVHYHPTAWRLHIHFQHVNSTSGSYAPGRSIYLDEVIENLEADGEYYSHGTLKCIRRVV